MGQRNYVTNEYRQTMFDQEYGTDKDEKTRKSFKLMLIVILVLGFIASIIMVLAIDKNC
jgi:Na+-driven multidrug efflux pump